MRVRMPMTMRKTATPAATSMDRLLFSAATGCWPVALTGEATPDLHLATN